MIYMIGQKLYGVMGADATVLELTVRDVCPDYVTVAWAGSEIEGQFSPHTGRCVPFRFVSESLEQAEARANALTLESLESRLRHWREETQKAMQKVDEINERIRRFKKRKAL